MSNTGLNLRAVGRSTRDRKHHSYLGDCPNSGNKASDGCNSVPLTKIFKVNNVNELIETVGSQRAPSCEHLACHFSTADEAKAETSKDVPWSVPWQGITGHQRGPLSESIFVEAGLRPRGLTARSQYRGQNPHFFTLKH